MAGPSADRIGRNAKEAEPKLRLDSQMRLDSQTSDMVNEMWVDEEAIDDALGLTRSSMYQVRQISPDRLPHGRSPLSVSV